MAITQDDRAALADLALRALDEIDKEYGDDAHLTVATLVFEVRATDPSDPDGEPIHWSSYKSLPGVSPQHVSGILRSTAKWVGDPVEIDDGDED